MDKISSIIPSNSRVTTVDMKASGVARGGTATFGRDTTASMQLDRLHHPVDVSGQAIERHNELMGQRETSKDPKVQIVNKITEKFFSTKEAENELPEIRPEEKFDVSAVQFNTPVRSNSSHVAQQESGASNNGEEDMPMTGGRLDVHA